VTWRLKARTAKSERTSIIGQRLTNTRFGRDASDTTLCYDGINTRLYKNERKRTFTARQRLATHAFPWQRIEQTNILFVEGGDLSSVRPTL
jgi:hypothetical protein